MPLLSIYVASTAPCILDSRSQIAICRIFLHAVKTSWFRQVLALYIRLDFLSLMFSVIYICIIYMGRKYRTRDLNLNTRISVVEHDSTNWRDILYNVSYQIKCLCHACTVPKILCMQECN